MGVVKIKVNNRALANKFKQALVITKRDKALQDDIGKFLVRRIKGFGKLGQPLNIRRAFPNLRPSTIRSRERLRQFNRTGKPFRPALSNLTLTGQFWKALTFEFDKTRAVLNVFWQNSKRKPYITSAEGSKAKRVPNNAQLFKFLREKGFDPFVKIDAKGLKTIKNKVVRQLRRDLQKNFRRK